MANGGASSLQGDASQDARAQFERARPLLREITAFAGAQPPGLKVLLERYLHFCGGGSVAEMCAESLLSVEASVARLKESGTEVVVYHRSDDFLTDWAFLVSPKAKRVMRKKPPSDAALVNGMTGQAIATKLAAFATKLARRAAGNAQTPVPPPSPSAHKFLGQRLDPRGTGEACMKRENVSQTVKARVKSLQMEKLDEDELDRLRANEAHAAKMASDQFGRGRESVWAFLPLEENPYAVLASGAEGPMVPRRSPKMMKRTRLLDGDGVKAASNSLIPKAKPKSKQNKQGKNAKATKVPKSPAKAAPVKPVRIDLTRALYHPTANPSLHCMRARITACVGSQELTLLDWVAFSSGCGRNMGC